MVNRDVSDVSYPITIKTGKHMNGGTLILNVIHGKELEIEYKKQLIIDKINSFFGYECLSHIKLKTIHKNDFKIKSKSNSIIKDKFENKIKVLKNQDLKKSLYKLIKAYEEKNY